MSKVEISSGLETIITPCLHLQFLWMGDHRKQEIVSVGGCQAIPRIWSIERHLSHDSPSMPASPAFRYLNITHDQENVTVAKLKGQSGPHRDTATFRFEEKPDEVVVDVIMNDQGAEAGRPLTATYLIESSAGQLHLDPRIATITRANPETHLVFEAEPPARVEANEEGMGTIRLKALADPAKDPHALHYRWRWVTVPGHQIWDREV